MKAPFTASELILTPAGAVYHLNLLPEQLAKKVILVGDPDRVAAVSNYFDQIYYKVQHREFITHTGRVGNTAITVVSTGIGTDNIDIVINELDALVNINLISRTEKSDHTSLQLLRLGTSGALQKDIAVDSLLASSHGLGIDGLMPFYEATETEVTLKMLQAIKSALPKLTEVAIPYLTAGSDLLLKQLVKTEMTGITLTSPGFYAPQGRELRYKAKYRALLEDAAAVVADGHRITNFEMETAGIYGLAHLLGHEALSVNAIIANRPLGIFSNRPAASIDRMIRTMLERFTTS